MRMYGVPRLAIGYPTHLQYLLPYNLARSAECLEITVYSVIFNIGVV
jgi:hypothetical protein